MSPIGVKAQVQVEEVPHSELPSMADYMSHFHNTVEHVEKEIRDMKDDEVPTIDIEMAIERRYPEVSGDVVEPHQPGTKPSKHDEELEKEEKHADTVPPGAHETTPPSDSATEIHGINTANLSPVIVEYNEDIGQATVIFESPMLAVKWLYLVEAPYEPMVSVNTPSNKGWVEMSRAEVGPQMAKSLDAQALAALGNKYPSFTEDLARHYSYPATSWQKNPKPIQA